MEVERWSFLGVEEWRGNLSRWFRGMRGERREGEMGCLYMFSGCLEITLGMFQDHYFCFWRNHCGIQAAAGRMSWNALDADVVLCEQVCGMKSIDGASVGILNAKLSDCEGIESRSQR